MLRLVLALGAWLLVSCAPADARREVLLFAASSWADVAPDLEAAFEDAHPELDLRVQLAGSQVLRLQIEAGADADAFVSADHAHADALRSLGWRSRAVAKNALVVITPPNDLRIDSPSDLPRARRLVLAAPEVPVGQYARRALTELGVREAAEARVVSIESNTRLVRAKVLLGEADAAIVYATDARGVDVRALPLPLATPPTYHLALRPEDPSARTHDARTLAAFLHGPGARILARHGFLAP